MWAEPRRARCPSSAVTLLLQRELGYEPRRPTHALAFDRIGEDRAAHYELEETKCSLPPSVRSTFLMAFSPDCTKVASTHGDHRIHVCEVTTGRLAHTLEGHPRTPWCLAFHPTSNHILASGCLAGQVRVWDLRGGSEVWSSQEGTVISSLAFHPLEPLLAIATANRVVLWDWRKGHALATCKTSSEREKVRFVQFCAPRGDCLVTGITNVDLGGPGPPRVLDPLLGPQVGALRVPAAPVDTGMSQRRSILTRLMSMYQHLEGLEEMVAPTLEPEPEEALQRARNYARDVTSYSTNLQRLNQLYQQQVQHVDGGSQGGAEDDSSADEEAGLSPRTSGSASAAATGPNSRYFWSTFYRLRSICSRLERRMQQHQLRSHPPPSSSSSLSSAMAGRRSGRPPRLRSWVPPHLFRRDGRSRPVPSRSAMTVGTAGGLRAAAASSHAPSSSSAGPSSSSAASSSTNREPPTTLGHPDVSVSLVSLLARLQMSLQSLSSAALTTAVAREQIHQVRVRITEILERLSNVSGYRARLTSLREEIFEAAAAAGPWSSRPDSGPSSWEGVTAEGGQPRTSSSVAAAAEERHPAAATRGGGEQQLEEPGEEATPSQHWDLAYCLWLVEMSLQLTRQMQRILAADYRLTQLHLNATSSTASNATATTTTATTSSSCSPPSLFSPFASQMGHTRQSSPPRTPPNTSAAASTSRSRGSPTILTTPPSARRSMECPRLRRHALRHRRHHRRHYRPFLGNTHGPGGSSSSSSDSLDSSDEDDQDLRRMRVDLSPDDDYPTSIPGRGLSAVGGVMGRNRFWPGSPPPAVLEEDPPIPEVHVSPPSSPPPVRPTAPVPPRPRSPPLPVILSGGPASRGGGGIVLAPLDPVWGGPPVPSAAYFSLIYDGGFRPRLSFYETGPNLTHRIQCWDMTGTELPDIGDAKACLVAPRCKIHNDASVALGGGLLAALVPCGLLGASLCVYSLRPRGTLLHTWSFGANAISVSLSPMARYLVVGFAATRGYFAQEREVVAQIFKLTPPDTDSSSSSGGGQLQQVGNLSQPGGAIGQPPVSLNSVRWLPRPGEGLIYGTNRGSLCICRPLKPISKEDGGSQSASRSGPTRDATSPFVMLTDQVDRTARNTTIQVLSTASQTVLPQTHTTGTQTTLRGSGLFVEQEQPVENSTAATASAISSPSSEASEGPSAGPSTSGASSSSEASSTSWYTVC